MSGGLEEFDDDELEFFVESSELRVAVEDARACDNPRLRELALAHLAEEAIQCFAKFADQALTADDEMDLPDEFRQALVDLVECGVNRPHWYQPGDRVVLPRRPD